MSSYIETYTLSSEYCEEALFAKCMKDNITIMPEFNHPIEIDDNMYIELTFETPDREIVHYIKKNQLRKIRWLIYRDNSQTERLIRNELLESCCRLCKISISHTIYKQLVEIMQAKKFYSKDQENCLMEMLSVIYKSFDVSPGRLFSLFIDRKSDPFDIMLSFYLKMYKGMYEGYCSCSCRDIDFNRKRRKSLF